MHSRTFLATVLLGCTLIAPLALAAGPRAAVPPATAPTPSVAMQPWYAVENGSQRCVATPSSSSPTRAMELFDAQHAHYTMDDVTEQGEIVQTTMLVFPSRAVPNGTAIRWYRGQARCEQAQRTEQQARERQRAKYQ